MSETYKVTLYTNTPYVGTDNQDTYDISEFGYTDEEWDALTERERENLVDEWAENEFWNQGFGYHGEVSK